VKIFHTILQVMHNIAMLDEGSLNCRITCYKRCSRVGICEDTDRLSLDYKILTNSNLYLHISAEKFGYFCVLG